MFISKGVLEREKDHIEGFAPEVAWVTKSGDSDLSEPIAIRPTSETVMYPSFAKWIRSHRDLPLRLNQWCNVVRWEFSHPTPFIRTREFPWQEGHTAWDSLENASVEVRQILDLYKGVYEQLLAIPVVQGRKTEKEKFAGGHYTTSVEAFVPTVGRGCQGATSHCLGQNFAKMFGIEFDDEKHTKQLAWQNSWGLTTRTIGLMVMVHGDDKGLVLPPRVASVQVVIVPTGVTNKTTEEQKKELMATAQKLAQTLAIDGEIRTKLDDRLNYSPGWRYNYWELKGVPLRIELGPKELSGTTYAVCRRDTGAKGTISKDDVIKDTRNLLETIQNDMLAKATSTAKMRLVVVNEWSQFVPTLNNKCALYSPWCQSMACEDEVKKVSGEESKAAAGMTTEDAKAPSMGAKSLCIPFEQPGDASKYKCIAPSCKKQASVYVLWGRSY